MESSARNRETRIPDRWSGSINIGDKVVINKYKGSCDDWDRRYIDPDSEYIIVDPGPIMMRGSNWVCIRKTQNDDVFAVEADIAWLIKV